MHPWDNHNDVGLQPMGQPSCVGASTHETKIALIAVNVPYGIETVIQINAVCPAKLCSDTDPWAVGLSQCLLGDLWSIAIPQVSILVVSFVGPPPFCGGSHSSGILKSKFWTAQALPPNVTPRHTACKWKVYCSKWSNWGPHFRICDCTK